MPVNKSKVIRLRLKHPCMPSSRIAEKMGVSRERIRQILKDAGVTTHFAKPKYHCVDCGKELRRKAIRCRECFIKHSFILIICDECNAPFYRRKSDILQYPCSNTYGHLFCSRHCRSVWRGKHCGFGAHPEHSRYSAEYVKKEKTK